MNRTDFPLGGVFAKAERQRGDRLRMSDARKVDQVAEAFERVRSHDRFETPWHDAQSTGRAPFPHRGG